MMYLKDVKLSFTQTFEDNNISNCNNMYNKLLTVIENMFCNLCMHRIVINFATNMSSCII